MTTETKPTAFCAWHPERGFAVEYADSNEQDAEIKMQQAKDFFDNPFFDDGWTIKPVWFSDKPPMGEVAIAEKFYDEVCKLAESNMLKTGKLEGSHFAAMQQVIKRWRDMGGEK